MANNIVMKITDYIAHLWHDTDNDIVMAENVNGWENTLQQHAEFLKDFLGNRIHHILKILCYFILLDCILN